jgi:hypothetical protein
MLNVVRYTVKSVGKYNRRSHNVQVKSNNNNIVPGEQEETLHRDGRSSNDDIILGMVVG